jgi:hypothetical protein
LYELAQLIPDVNVLLALEPEELGAKLLFVLRKRKFARDQFPPSALNEELWSPHAYTTMPGQQTAYPQEKREAIELSLIEAWAWLWGQGLIVPAADPNGRNGWRRLSRRARRFAITVFRVAREKLSATQKQRNHWRSSPI